MTKPDGGYAFPSPIAVGPAEDVYAVVQAEFGTGGMTLRDHFASQALTAILSNNILLDAISDANPEGKMNELVARDAYTLADAMLKERATP